ncbi:hypothetical protein [Bradyrhizobium sp. Ai1a-2]|uniref:hypothetical protein n=1 Tax=Bradyrhizobium sp. Ai1a-2 TaxID=196490 RepID=UPI001268CA6B|nr:hypothetical protein [Bradyrhizobium sp. Ai1a-2]
MTLSTGRSASATSTWATSAYAPASPATRRSGAGLAASNPGTEPGQHRYGAAATFDDARAAFALAWQKLAATRTDADYQAWRDHRDWTMWKYRMHDLHLPLPTQRPDGVARCFCGEAITSATMDDHVLGAHRSIEQ